MTTRAFTSPLQLQLPYDRGFDVLALQQRLRDLNLQVGTPDGIYGPQTAAAMRVWQTTQGLPATGICDESNWKRLFPEASDASGNRLGRMLPPLRQDHTRLQGGCTWRLEQDGLHINNQARKARVANR